MNNIEVGVIAEHGSPAEIMGFLARITQRSHNITSLKDIEELLSKPVSAPFVDALMKMDLHGTIKRFTPITVAIVGASRRFLAQARTNQVGINYVSGSLQYSDFSDSGRFVVPYALLRYDNEAGNTSSLVEAYLRACEDAMRTYSIIAEATDNDTAGYASPQGLRNVLIMQGNTESWLHFIKSRTCNRNTEETQYISFRIWEELLKTEHGEEIFKYAGPTCMWGACTEGKLCCGTSLRPDRLKAESSEVSTPRFIINTKWPLLKDVK